MNSLNVKLVFIIYVLSTIGAIIVFSYSVFNIRKIINPQGKNKNKPKLFFYMISAILSSVIFAIIIVSCIEAKLSEGFALYFTVLGTLVGIIIYFDDKHKNEVKENTEHKTDDFDKGYHRMINDHNNYLDSLSEKYAEDFLKNLVVEEQRLSNQYDSFGKDINIINKILSLYDSKTISFNLKKLKDIVSNMKKEIDNADDLIPI